MQKALKCYVCEGILDKNIIGLNEKLFDKKIKRYLCFDCLSGHLDVSIEDLYAKINEFKEQGCTLFM